MVDLINISRDAPKEPAAFLLLKKCPIASLQIQFCARFSDHSFEDIPTNVNRESSEKLANWFC